MAESIENIAGDLVQEFPSRHRKFMGEVCRFSDVFRKNENGKQGIFDLEQSIDIAGLMIDIQPDHRLAAASILHDLYQSPLLLPADYSER